MSHRKAKKCLLALSAHIAIKYSLIRTISWSVLNAGLHTTDPAISNIINVQINLFTGRLNGTILLLLNRRSSDLP